ncbi:MAG: peptidase M50 [uncultured bacterium]|nr:MAG: peptidase M50 [uncultured bacterium]HBD05317.1 site-2 protease family protein [Candidatus Uhrbacteria bacterium]
MFLELLRQNPTIAIAWVLSIMLALTVHEFSHALVGKWRGDSTAEQEGRLSLNPFAHIDWFGFIPLLLLGFGWAKPVPFNPYNLKNPKWDSVLIAIAGPVSNFLFALFSGLAFRFLVGSGLLGLNNLLSAFLLFLVLINLFLMLFNVIPIHPLDGSKLFFALFDAPKYEQLRKFVAYRGPQILLVLVLVAVLTNINIFFFVNIPAFLLCDTIISGSCIELFSLLFLV